MIGKKDNHDIFKQYKQVLLEQVEDDGISSLLNRIKSSSLDPKTKGEIISLLNMESVKKAYSMMVAQKEHGIGDMDAAGYSDQDDQDTENPPDPDFAKELAKARDEQQKKYPEARDVDEEESDLGKYNYQTGCYEKESREECEARKAKHKIAMGSFAKL